MTDVNNLGTKGEELACNFLVNKGYFILERNWRNSHQEIDIIARDRKNIVFIEVKTRSANPLINPTEAVTRNKQKLIIKAANVYFNMKHLTDEVRFDIITIIIKGENNVFEHIEDAYSPTLR